MPSLLDDPLQLNQGGPSSLLQPPLQIQQPDPNQPDLGQGYADIYNRVSDYIAKQRQIAQQQGLWDDSGPTSKGLLDAAHQVAGGILMGSTAPGEGAGITAFHGSPHDFDAFDASKIGTGEGSQSFGRGLYFAEQPGVAESYRSGLSVPEFTVDGKPLLEALNSRDNTPAQSLALETLHRTRDLDQATSHIDNRASFDPEYADAKQWLDANKDSIAPAQGGHMYEVNINANPQHFLDWDAPLSEQHPVVQDAVRQAGLVDPAPKIEWVGDKDGWELQQNGKPTGTSLDTTGNRSYNQYSDGKWVGEIPAASVEQWKDLLAQSHQDAWRDPDPTGRDIIKNNPRAQPEQQLQDAGIPGIKYLDQGSRGAGEGTRNYVVFSPDIINIARKYAVPAAVLSGTGAGLAQGNQ